MADQGSESGLEVVLDNRKIIIIFAVLIAICGCFFVVGFIEGKRQGFQEGAQALAESVPKGVPGSVQTQEAEPAGANPAAGSLKEDANEQPLGWYKSVSRKEREADNAQRIMPAPAPKTEPALPAAPKPKPKVDSARSAPFTYSVQVGAFRRKPEAETKASMLRAKGYECRIEPPQSSEQLYLIKVGKFNSRADAIAMQLRLKKNGFASFIKTN